MPSESLTRLEDPLTWRQDDACCWVQILAPLHVGLSLGLIQCPHSRGPSPEASNPQTMAENSAPPMIWPRRSCTLTPTCSTVRMSQEGSRLGKEWTPGQGSLGAIVEMVGHTVATVYYLESRPSRQETIHATYLYALVQFLKPF